MIAREVAQKYSNALFMLSQEKNVTSDIYLQLSELGKIVQAEKRFLEFLKSPRVTETEKKTFVQAVLKNRAHPLLAQFLIVLIEKGRIGFLNEVIDEFNRKVEAVRGIGRATVISAAPLKDAEKKKLIDKLSAKLNLKIMLEEEIDTKVMGGVIVITHDQIIDGSVRHGLDMLEQSLSKVRVA